MHTTLKAQSTSTKHISGHCLLEHASCALGGGIGIRRAPLLFSLPFSFSLPSCQKPQKKRAKEIKMPRVHPRGRLFWTLACVWRDTFGCRWYLRSCWRTHTHTYKRWNTGDSSAVYDALLRMAQHPAAAPQHLSHLPHHHRRGPALVCHSSYSRRAHLLFVRRDYNSCRRGRIGCRQVGRLRNSHRPRQRNSLSHQNACLCIATKGLRWAARIGRFHSRRCHGQQRNDESHPPHVSRTWLLVCRVRYSRRWPWSVQSICVSIYVSVSISVHVYVCVGVGVGVDVSVECLCLCLCLGLCLGLHVCLENEECVWMYITSQHPCLCLNLYLCPHCVCVYVQICIGALHSMPSLHCVWVYVCAWV